ncbi:MAG: O-antigen ligase family protein [Planctomycetes bacterium]|nr:O-antigen ligase family protein [Planctomycetota bacterium]
MQNEQIENTFASPDIFDAVIERLLIVLLAFMPFAFGAVHAWSEQIVIALSATIAFCFMLKLLSYKSQPFVWTWAYLPVAILLLVIIFQLIPLPASVINAISPNTFAMKTELMGDLPNADTLLKSMTLSFYPYATKHDLRLVLAIVVVFVVVLNVYRHPEQIKRLLMAIAVIGGIIAAITLAQNLFGNGKIYWLIYNKNTRGYSGPFVNHSNYGQFMNLSIAAALALLAIKLHEAFGGKKVVPSTVSEYFSSSSTKPLWLLMAIISLGAATVFITLTRGGMVSMLIAAAFTTMIITTRKSLRAHSWIMVLVALVAFTCILYIGFDAVYDRLASIRQFDKVENGRIQILKDIAVAWTKFPILGTGLGTHSVVYPMFDRSFMTQLAAHAENEYAQLLEETGLVGLILMIVFGVIVWSNYAKIIRKPKAVVCSAVYGLGFGILAILIHSLSDFGQHLPANAALTAIFCALLLGLAKQPQIRIARTTPPSPKYRFMGLIILISLPVIYFGPLSEANNYRIAEKHWGKTMRMEKNITDRNWQGTDREYDELIAHASQALKYQPENIKYRHWTNVYRLRSVSRTTDAYTRDIIISPDEISTLRSIVDQFHQARLVCPTYGPSYSMAGQIELFFLNDDSGAEKIRKGFQLAPCDPVACFVAASLDVREGKTDDAVQKFNRAVNLNSRLWRNVTNIYVYQLSRPHQAIALAGNDIGRLSSLAEILDNMHYEDLAEQTRFKLKQVLEQKCAQPNPSAWTFAHMAAIYRKQENNTAAIEYYQRALDLEYSKIYWRMELAKLLEKTGKIQDAIYQARICLRIRPQFKQAEKFIADLSVKPSAIKQKFNLP